VNQIRAFADKGGGKPIVVLTVVGSSIPDFLREFANQGIKATDVAGTRARYGRGGP
jgi:urea transport system substrate-binding protein